MKQMLSDADRAWTEEMFARLDGKLAKVAVTSRGRIPYTVDGHGRHDDRSNDPQMWTNGFFGGLMWLMFAATGNEAYKETATCAEAQMDLAFENVLGLDHDVGFLWHIQSGANYRLTGDAAAKNRNFLCAMTLASRFKLNGRYIRAWNGDVNDGWTIIDTMMNLPLLFWASRELGDDRFAQIARAHADTALSQHIRPDGSVNHIVTHDLCTGEMNGTKGGQGYGEGSCWSRGLSWALYGYALAFRHTGDERYLRASKRVADHAIVHLQDADFLPLVDFCAPSTPVYYDSTAGAIIACGLIELAEHLPAQEKAPYLQAALKLLRALEAAFCNWEEDFDAILCNGTERYGNADRPLPIIYGDFFFAEAILKLRGEAFSPWH